MSDADVHLDATTSSDDKGIVSYAWNFDKYPDGTGSGSVVSATYPHADSRTVTLVVTDAEGLTNTVSKTIQVGAPVNQIPVVSFTYSCTYLTCFFDASATTDDGTIPHSGTRQVTLTVTDAAGQKSTVTQTLPLP